MEKTMKLWNGRVAKFIPRTMNTHTGWVTSLKRKEVKSLGLAYSSKYGYSISDKGVVERWYCGYGGPIAQHALPIALDDDGNEVTI